jgi:hypothetical protein
MDSRIKKLLASKEQESEKQRQSIEAERRAILAKLACNGCESIPDIRAYMRANAGRLMLI